MKVNNMISSKGNTVANQFIITDGNKEVFQSYNTVIAENRGGQIVLDVSAYDYSRTTSRYLNQFLGHDKAESMAKIEAGVYLVENLNINEHGFHQV